MNIVEFIIRLQDDMSDPLGDLKKNTLGAKYTTDQLTEANTKLQKAAGKSSGSIYDLRSKIDQLKKMKELLPAGATTQMKAVNKEIEKLQRGINKLEGVKPTGMFSSFADAIPPIFKNPLTYIGATAAASINQGLKNSKTKLDFELLLGKDSGDSLFKNLKSMKSVLGDGVFDFGKDLANSGMAVEKILPMITRLGDVAAGDEQKLGGLTKAFADLQKDGKLTENTLGQLEAGGFKPLVLMHLQTGESMKSLRKRFDENKISAKEVGKALERATAQGGQFYGNLKKINDSPTGKWNELTGKISELVGWLGEMLLPVAMEVVDFLIWGFDKVREPLGAVVGWLKDKYGWIKENRAVIEPLVTILGGFAIGIWAVVAAKTAWAAITGGLTTAIEFMSAAIMSVPVFGWILAAIAAIIAAVVYMRNNFEGFGVFFNNLWEQNKAAFNIFVSFIKQGFEWIGYHLKKAWLNFKFFGEYVGALFSNIGNAIKLALEFKFSEAKEALTAKITTSAEGEIDNLEKDHAENQKYYESERLIEAFKIVNHPLEGIIKRIEDKDKKDAAQEAVGTGPDGKPTGYREGQDTKGKNLKEEMNAISGGGVKNITVTIGKIFDHPVYQIQNGTKQAVQEMERMMEEAMVRVIASASAK